ncbi:hypothetical protein QFS06_001431 [Escherichia coli]|nr:hypothetical protein [Escherichia coli]
MAKTIKLYAMHGRGVNKRGSVANVYDAQSEAVRLAEKVSYKCMFLYFLIIRRHEL